MVRIIYIPVEHCITGTAGWKLYSPLDEYRIKHNCQTFDKGCFGSIECAMYIEKLYQNGQINKIIIVGYCTDICVVSNALLIKSLMPELPVYVDSEYCAGVTPDKHMHALDTMASCQIIVE